MQIAGSDGGYVVTAQVSLQGNGFRTPVMWGKVDFCVSTRKSRRIARYKRKKQKKQAQKRNFGILSITWMNVTAYRSVFPRPGRFPVPGVGCFPERLRYDESLKSAFLLVRIDLHTMGNRLFVGNISFRATPDMIRWNSPLLAKCRMFTCRWTAGNRSYARVCLRHDGN